ncbi:hypothetical protein WR25_00275 [Diploscapter pachys]|uniref:Arrestin C-terminal-like domain-containing protein n=1 Tax=Diploscapter pachys TaxID=2018661 RepID=A0A2A2J489_9BILA|nr:hypothetical protein WR25_00275 [Diploscapter pachys]
MVCSKKVRIGGLMVRLTGVAETGWRNRDSDLMYESRHTFMDELIDLTTVVADHCTEEFEIYEGRHSVDFEGTIPLDILSSVEVENYGAIRHMCTAVMPIPEDGDTEVIAEKSFKVFAMLNLDAPYMREPTQATEDEEIIGCCGRANGSIEATMKVAEVGLLAGEKTRITLIVENKSKKRRWRRKKERHECVLISLCQQLDFVATNRYDPDLMDRRSLTVAVENHGTCKAQPGMGVQTKEIEFEIPNGLPPTSVHANRLITISYFFKVDFEQFDVVVPVIIGTSKTPGPIG